MGLDDLREKFGDRVDWTLVFLHAKVFGRPDTPTVGNTRLMKGLFLVDRKLLEYFDEQTDFRFESDRYGPSDPRVYPLLRSLERHGLIARPSDSKYDGTRHELTTEGRASARKIAESLPADRLRLVEWVREKHTTKPLSAILAFVYRQYPEYAESSVIRDRVLDEEG